MQEDHNVPKSLELNIESQALKKQLARELFELYGNKRIIFTEYKKDSSLFLVRRWKPSKYESMLSDKFADVPAHPMLSKIMNGVYKTATVIHEDE